MFISVAFKWYRSDDKSYEGTNTEDPVVNFEQEANQPEIEEDEGMEFPPELERMVAQEDREMRLHQEETKIKNLGFGDEKNEVKVGIGRYRHGHTNPRWIGGLATELPRHLRLVVPRYAWFEPRHCVASFASKTRVFPDQAKVAEDEGRDVPKN